MELRRTPSGRNIWGVNQTGDIEDVSDVAPTLKQKIEKRGGLVLTSFLVTCVLLLLTGIILGLVANEYILDNAGGAEGENFIPQILTSASLVMVFLAMAAAVLVLKERYYGIFNGLLWFILLASFGNEVYSLVVTEPSAQEMTHQLLNTLGDTFNYADSPFVKTFGQMHILS